MTSSYKTENSYILQPDSCL